MVVTRKSLGNAPIANEEEKKRRNSSPFKKLYPDLSEGVSYTSSVFERTCEIQEDEDSSADTSFESRASSQSSKSFKTPKNSEISWKTREIAAIFAVVIAILVVLVITNKRNAENQSSNAYETYIKSVRNSISTDFRDISQENKNILRLIGQKVFLEPQNRAPLVILVGGATARQLSEAMSQIIRSTIPTKNPENSAKIPPIRVEPHTNRAELHENLRLALGTPSDSPEDVVPRSAVVLDVDLLKWDAVLVLHAFADHENFPIPKIVLFLTVFDGEFGNFGNHDMQECNEEKMVRFLTNRWIENGGSSDNIPPIIARISHFICV